MGLMQAAEEFDPDRGFRFARLPMWWIRARSGICAALLVAGEDGHDRGAEEAVLQSAQAQGRMEELEQGDLPPETVRTIATELRPGVQVIEMNRRLGSADTSLNALVGNDADSEWLELLPDERPSHENLLADRDEDSSARKLGAALKVLDQRERDIIVEQRLKDS